MRRSFFDLNQAPAVRAHAVLDDVFPEWSQAYTMDGLHRRVPCILRRVPSNAVNYA